MSELIRKFTVELVKSTLNVKPRYTNANNIFGFAVHQPMMVYSLFYMGATKERIQ